MAGVARKSLRRAYAEPNAPHGAQLNAASNSYAGISGAAVTP